MRLPAGGAVTGWAALRLMRGGEVRVLQGVAVTCAERAVFDEMRRAGDVREAVVALDMAAAAEITSVARMRVEVALRSGWDGVPLVRRALDLAHELSRSPNETRMRLVWMLDAGLPAPLVNQPVWDLRGRILGIADLFDPVEEARHRRPRTGRGPDGEPPPACRVAAPARRRWTLTPPPTGSRGRTSTRSWTSATPCVSCTRGGGRPPDSVPEAPSNRAHRCLRN